MSIEDRHPLSAPPSNGERVVDDVRAWMERKSGKPVTREEARDAAENLANVGRLLVQWIRRADAADPGWRDRPVPPPTPRCRPKTSTQER